MKRRVVFPIASFLAAVLLYTPLLYLRTFDLESLFYLLGLGVITVLLALGVSVRWIIVRRQASDSVVLRNSMVLAVVAFWCASLLMFHEQEHLRPWARWTIASSSYKSLVMQQTPDPLTGLRHAEWDGWGWAGMDTSVQLVYDPSGTLGAEIRHRSAGRFPEVARKTASVQRIALGWYSLTLYTNEEW